MQDSIAKQAGQSGEDASDEKSVTFPVSEKLWRQMKVEAAIRDVMLKDLIGEAFAFFLAKKGSR